MYSNYFKMLHIEVLTLHYNELLTSE